MSEARRQECGNRGDLPRELMETKDTIARNALELAEKTMRCDTAATELRAQADFLKTLVDRLRGMERAAKMQGLEPKEIYQIYQGTENLTDFEMEFQRLKQVRREEVKNDADTLAGRMAAISL